MHTHTQRLPSLGLTIHPAPVTQTQPERQCLATCSPAGSKCTAASRLLCLSNSCCAACRCFVRVVCFPGRAGVGCPVCPQGTWSRGGDAATSVCTSCGPGLTTTAPGATGPEQCLRECAVVLPQTRGSREHARQDKLMQQCLAGQHTGGAHLQLSIESVCLLFAPLSCLQRLRVQASARKSPRCQHLLRVHRSSLGTCSPHGCCLNCAPPLARHSPCPRVLRSSSLTLPQCHAPLS